MSANPVRRRDRLGGRAVAEALRYRDAILLAGQGCSCREIAARLGYRTPSAAVHAVARGVELSRIRPGLARVVAEKVHGFDARYDRWYESAAPAARETADMFGFDLHLVGLRLGDVLRDAGTVDGVRDVARLISWRTPGLPGGDTEARERRLQLRMMEGTLDQIRGGYRDRSGVHRAIDQDLRRELLTAVARVHVVDLGHLRGALQKIDTGFRRPRPHWDAMSTELARTIAILESLGVLPAASTPTNARGARSDRPGVLRPWVADSRTRVAG